MLDLFDGPLAAQHTLRFLEEKCHAGVYSWDLKHNQMQWSPGAFALLGIPPGSVTPSFTLYNSLVHPEDRLALEEFESLVRDGLPYSRECRIIQHDGRMRWLSQHNEFILDANGAATKLIGVVTDVTGKHEASQALIASQARFREIVLGVAPIVWVADGDGMMRAVIGVGSVTGHPDSSALGMGWTRLLHPDDEKGTVAAWRAAIEVGEFFHNEFRLIQAGGGYRWYRAYGVPVTTRNGRVNEWNGLTLDIRADSSAFAVGELPPATGAQIRASRAILKWSVSDLCEASGVSPAVIRRLEEFDGAAPRSAVPAEAIRRAVVAAGVELVFSPDGKPGVRPAIGNAERQH